MTYYFNKLTLLSINLRTRRVWISRVVLCPFAKTLRIELHLNHSDLHVVARTDSHWVDPKEQSEHLHSGGVEVNDEVIRDEFHWDEADEVGQLKGLKEYAFDQMKEFTLRVHESMILSGHIVLQLLSAFLGWSLTTRCLLLNLLQLRILQLKSKQAKFKSQSRIILLILCAYG